MPQLVFQIACLEEHRKTAKTKYTEHLNTYVTMQLGRPLEKLNYFFEGIESKVAQGVKMEEIGYQMAFSRFARLCGVAYNSDMIGTI